MPVVVLAGSKTVIGLLAVVCVLVVLQLSPTGFFRACDQSRVLAGPLASKPDRSGQAGRRLVEADEPTGVARMIVAATQDPAEASWIQEKLKDIATVRVYQVVKEAERRAACQNATAANNTDTIKALSCWPHMASGAGREASVYLQYIVDEYDHGLADTTVFLHGHIKAWHRPPVDDFAVLLRRLRWGEIGFGSLRTWGMLGSNFWDTAVFIDPIEPSRCSNITRNAGRWHGFCHYQGDTVQRTWQDLRLNETFGRMPHEIRAPGCCAEFVVSRRRIRARPKQFYVDLLARLDALGSDHPDSPYALEHCWHAFFGEPWISYGIGKCELVTCSEDEENDPDLKPPASINDPYSFHKPPKPTEVCQWDFDEKTWHCEPLEGVQNTDE